MFALQQIKHTASLIKFSHTLFALPFALSSLLMATQGAPQIGLTVKIILAMFFARNTAMAFNRLADANYDAKNPRTADREIPKGLLSKKYVTLFIIVNALFFIGTTATINKICFILSVPTLFILCFYTISKRFFSGTQLLLGLSLGLSPSAAWIAATGTIDVAAFLLSLAVFFWVAGFDLIYSTLDYEFDKTHQLKNLVVRLGISKALILSKFLHSVSMALLLIIGLILNRHAFYFAGIGLQSVFLIYEHSLVKPHDLSRVNMAFFTMNGAVSIVYLLATFLDYTFQF